MGYWLARELTGQESGWIKRFDPRFWTINFPRPMMASVVTTAPNGLRVDVVSYRKADLAGLIWESEDREDHPLLAYETARDFRDCVLRFRWRSEGLRPLDAIGGPTLTIEGRDQAGNPRAWYVRLWNYAAGTPEDAWITLDFGTLLGGFALPGEGDPVWAGDIDRMFISIVGPGYEEGVEEPLAAPHNGWAELSGIACDGAGSVLEIGDVILPEHGFSIATGYDDSYHVTPERMLRNALQLGYRGAINHYVGMSHYFRLEALSGGYYVSLTGGALNGPCAAWHRDFAARARAMGFGLILSLSYELFDAHCWNDWKQRAENGDPALTGWEPPSTLLSPAHQGAMGYLQAVARAFVAIARDAGHKVRFQVGEPWWWVTTDGRICLYDNAARAAFGPLLVSLPEVTAAMDEAACAMLDRAGEMLSASTAALAAAARAEALGEAETLLLVYLPSVLDERAPEVRRANVPVGWASPAFDVLQLEDYDWVTEGRRAATGRGVAVATARLGYPIEEQHYLAGFVLRPDQSAQWRLIDDAADAARARGTKETFIWALPQVIRDGFTHFDENPTKRSGKERDVQAFDDVDFPLALGREASVSPAFSTAIVTMASGHEQRNADWSDARLRFDAGPGIRSEQDMGVLISFFRGRRGAARGFRFRDPFDHSSSGMTGMPGPLDQRIGTGDGRTAEFPIVKHYGDGDDPQLRDITRPVAGSVMVAVDGAEVSDWSLMGGTVVFDAPPAEGAVVTAGYLFDVPVRFAEDRLEISRATFLAGEAVSVPLIEIREDGR